MRKFLLVTFLVMAVNLQAASAAYYDQNNNGNSWDDAYIIASSGDMALMKERIENGDETGKYYMLNADISLSNWQAIEIFTGHFDGQHHTITINGTQGLFGEIIVSNDAIAVRNLNLAGNVSDYGSILASKLESGIIDSCNIVNGTLSGTSYYAGGLIRVMSGGIVRNCAVKADIFSSNYDAGGIIGQMWGGTVEGCTLEAGSTVRAAYNAGGIAGYADGGNIRLCTTAEGVNITASNDAGGIAGVIDSRTVIENCSLGTNSTVNASASSGGIVGASSGGTVQSCSVSENVRVMGDESGGVVGQLNGGTLNNCTVSQGLIVTGSTEAGGIAGFSYGRSVIDGCELGVNAVIRSSGNAGGIVSYITSGTLRSCTVSDSADISGTSDAGGIAAEAAGSSVIESCDVKNGVVVSGGENSGGIVGNASATIRGCKTGTGLNVKSSGNYAGGIAGAMSGGNIEGCTVDARVSVEARSYAGGVAGYIRSANVSACTLAEDAVIRSSEKAGGIVGSISAGNVVGCDVSENVRVSSSGEAGGIAGSILNGDIDGCTLEAGLVITASSDAGGIVGNIREGSVKNCTLGSNTSVNSSGNAGGIAGVTGSGSIIENCGVNQGSSVIASENAGGIVGNMADGVIDSCTVKSGTSLTASGNAGGIAGSAAAGVIRNCTVENGIRMTAAGRFGGIVGDSGSGLTLEGNKWPSNYSDVGRDNPQISWNNHRYQAFNENLTWEEAKSRCESSGGHLVTITSSLEQEHVEALLRQSQTPYNFYWIGAKSDASGWLEWVTDEVLERQYNNFAEGRPDGSGNYVHVSWNTDDAGKWYDAKSDSDNHGYICEWDDEPQAIQEAPAADDFQTWLQNPDAWENTDSNIPAGSRPIPTDTSHLSSNPPNVEMVTIPVSYDARSNSGLPPVRSQGVYETCWAFAALGAMETDYMKRIGHDKAISLDLSELHLAWFAYKDPSSDYFTSNNLQSVLNRKGDPNLAVSLLNRTAIAPINEEDMPYSTAGDNASTSNSSILSFLNGRTVDSFRKSRITLTDVNELPQLNEDYTQETETMNYIKQQIMEHGAVYFSYVNAEQGYNSDYSTYYSTNVNEGHHAALLVGWDDNYPAANFKNNPQTNGAWLVRTSRWSNQETGEPVSVGDDEYGCFWMSYAQAGGGGINDLRSFTVSEDKSPVEERGSNNRTKDITSAWGARIFRATRNEKVIRVSFHTTDNNMSYQLFINNFGKKAPTDPGHAENPLSEGEIGFAGYHTVSLGEGVNLYEGDYYSVIVKMTSQSDVHYRYPTAVEASIDKYIAVSVNEGESFFADGDDVPSLWQDGAYVDGGPYNACIMTFSEERITYDTAPTITTTALSQATVGESYSFMLSSSGTQTIEWRSGNIPDDFTLSRSGLLTGEPKNAGQYELSLTAINDVGYEEKNFTLTVNAAGTPDNKPEDKPDDKPNDNPDDKPNDPPDDKPDDKPEQEIAAGSGTHSGCDAGAGMFAVMIVLVLAVRRVRVK